jgi:cytochrome P450
MLLWGSANRDDAHFQNPDVFDMDVQGRRSHFSFGHGIHLCLGNPLARREVRIVVEEVLAKFGAVELARDAPACYYMPSSFTRSLARLNVRLGQL